ncbi:MAG: YihY/virulence factor BrkB family protein [Gemmatimonadota bacterium]|nr:YihY/virulence factor BrkB family protein [Gemmatimonadota bacterium]
MPPRSATTRAGWILRDYARRVWDNSGEDNVFFLAGGLAFNIVLAAVPFFLLVVTGLTFLLDRDAASSSALITSMLEALLPPQAETLRREVLKIFSDVLEERTSLAIYSAIGFVWFSTRLFGSLRSVLAEVFDIENERGIIAGKIFDIKITIIASVLIVLYAALSFYLAIYTRSGVQLLAEMGIRAEAIGSLQYWLGQLVAFTVIFLMFFALYKYLPLRRVRARTAVVAALFTTVLFELARHVFARLIGSFHPGSLYTGTIAALVIAVVWVYYSALIFILGGEVGQVFELRRTRRLQRAVLYE